MNFLGAVSGFSLLLPWLGLIHLAISSSLPLSFPPFLFINEIVNCFLWCKNISILGDFISCNSFQPCSYTQGSLIFPRTMLAGIHVFLLGVRWKGKLSLIKLIPIKTNNSISSDYSKLVLELHPS